MFNLLANIKLLKIKYEDFKKDIVKLIKFISLWIDKARIV